MIGLLLFLFGILVVLGLCGLAAWSDFKGFRIPNIISVIIAASFFVVFGVLTLTEQRHVVFGPILLHVGAAGVVFLVTGLLFALKQLGAGDSKFATAVALWLGLTGLVPFLFYMAFTGGLIGVASIYLKKKKPLKNPPAGSWPDKAQQGHPSVPYGIAIAVGTFAGFIFRGYLSPSVWEQMFL